MSRYSLRNGFRDTILLRHTDFKTQNCEEQYESDERNDGRSTSAQDDHAGTRGGGAQRGAIVVERWEEVENRGS